MYYIRTRRELQAIFDKGYEFVNDREKQVKETNEKVKRKHLYLQTKIIML